MMAMRVAATATVMSTIVFLLSLPETQLSLGGEPKNKVESGVTIPTLQRAIENRFGRPDRIVGEENSLLQYRLENGDTLTLVLAHERVLGIEYAKKNDLRTAVGKKLTLVGVYNGFAKGDDQIVMADGQSFWLQGRNNVFDDGKLVSVTGVREYFPGTNGPVYVQGVPAHYYMKSDSTELKLLYPLKFLNRTPIEPPQQKESGGSGDPFE